MPSIRTEQVDTLYNHPTRGVLGALAAAAVLEATLIALGDLAWSTAAIWFALGVGVRLFHLVLLQAVIGVILYNNTLLWS
jgi:hypothetical protein